jgi:hypothetical protein
VQQAALDLIHFPALQAAVQRLQQGRGFFALGRERGHGDERKARHVINERDERGGGRRRGP